jgi:response regulator RpfG family c-di-GMP phosphodiesterase
MGIVVHSNEIEDGPTGEEGRGNEWAKDHMKGTVALLVEDNWAHQVVMERRLQQVGCTVLTAVSGRDALRVLKKEEAVVDIIFIDLQMPLLVRNHFLLLLNTD